MSSIYRHAPYAATKADLWKHLVLFECVNLLPKESTLIDSHAGPGAYLLEHGGRWMQGLGSVDSSAANFVAWLEHPWFKTVWEHYQTSSHYYGSWVQLANHPHCSKVWVADHCEKVISEAKKTACQLNISDKLEFFQGESFAWTQAQSHQADMCFIDPAFSLKDGLGDDWPKLAHLLTRLECDFVAWYPVYGEQKPQTLREETNGVSIELYWPLKKKTAFTALGCGMIMNEELYRKLEESGKVALIADFAGLLGCEICVKR